jgi:hypothetical protein
VKSWDMLAGGVGSNWKGSGKLEEGKGILDVVGTCRQSRRRRRRANNSTEKRRSDFEGQATGTSYPSPKARGAEAVSWIEWSKLKWVMGGG